MVVVVVEGVGSNAEVAAMAMGGAINTIYKRLGLDHGVVGGLDHRVGPFRLRSIMA